VLDYAIQQVRYRIYHGTIKGEATVIILQMK
jgi:hypothetical protein